MKSKKFKSQASKFMQYLNLSLFSLASLLLVAFTLITYVYGIIEFITVTDIGNAGNVSGSSDALGKTLTVIAMILLFLVILAVIVGMTYGLFLLAKRYFKSLESDNVEYYVFNKRWIDCIIAVVLSLANFFGFRYLFNYFIPWHNSIMAFVLGGVYGLIAILMFTFWLYNKIWFNSKPKEFKENYTKILNEIQEKKKEKQALNKNK